MMDWFAHEVSERAGEKEREREREKEGESETRACVQKMKHGPIYVTCMCRERALFIDRHRAAGRISWQKRALLSTFPSFSCMYVCIYVCMYVRMYVCVYV
jgi:hypothetical protein